MSMESEDIGVYFLKKGNDVVYVGQSKTSLLTRVAVHKNEKIKEFDSAVFIPLEFDDIDKVEIEMIDKYKPAYNVAKGGGNKVKKQSDLEPEKKKKQNQVMMRLNDYELNLFKEAAASDERRTIDWMRVTLVKAAKKQIGIKNEL